MLLVAMATRRDDGGIDLVRAFLLVVLFVAGAYFGVGLAGAIGALSGDGSLALEFERARHDPVLASLAQLLSGGFAIVVGASLAFGDGERPLRASLAVFPVRSVLIVLALTSGFALAFVLREMATLTAVLVPATAPPPERAMALVRNLRIESIFDAVVVPLCFVAIPALVEELFFRGVILPGLAHRLAPRRALVVSAVLFGLIHLTPIGIVVGTVAGLILGWVRLRSGSVLPSIALHGATNAAAVMLPVSLIRIEGFNTLGETPTHLGLPLLLGAIGVVAGCLYGIFRFSEPDL